MRRVVVTVKRENETRVQDLELPADVPVREWLGELVTVLDWPRSDEPRGGYSLVAHGPRTPEKGIPVPQDACLCDVGVRDGFWLVGVAARAQVPPSAPVLSSPDEGGPKIEWVRIVPESRPKEGEATSIEAQDKTSPDWMNREIKDL